MATKSNGGRVVGVWRMKGNMMVARRRKYRIGIQTVNFASIGVVASAIAVVLEVTAPSSAPPVVFASAAQASHPDSPTLPLETTTPAVGQEPLHGGLLGGLSSTSSPWSGSSGSMTSFTPASASSVVPSSRALKLSHSAGSTHTVVLTSVLRAAEQRSHVIAAARRAAAQHFHAIAAARRQSISAAGIGGVNLAGVGNSSGNSSGSGVGNNSHIAKAGALVAGTAPQPRPNVAVGGGNENAGNGAGTNGHASSHAYAPLSRSQAAGPAQPEPPVNAGRGASARPGWGIGGGPRNR